MSTAGGESGREARAGPIINAIREQLEEIGLDPDVAANKSLSWDDPRHRRMIREKFDDGGAGEAILPGFGETGGGENARDDCGDPHPFVCNGCGHTVEFGRTCGMSVCSRCAQVWARDTGIKKAAKLRRVRIEKNQSTPENQLQKFHHAVISPPADWYYDQAQKHDRETAQENTRTVVKKILEELRAPGVLARHSYRGVDEDEDGAILREDDDRGEWKKRLFAGRRWYGDVRDELGWKPHYHAIVVSDWIKGEELTKTVEEETGWVITRLARDDGISLENDGDMARAVTYAISHADIQVRKDGNNRSAVWEVGVADGDPIKSSSRFSAKPHDFEWAEAAVREIAWRILGIRSGTTDCGANIPGVDDPDELARRVLLELYPHPDDEELRSGIPTEAVLYHISENNISVDVSTTSGGGGSVTVTSAFGLSHSGGSIELGSRPNWDVPPGVTASGGIDVDEPAECDHDVDDDREDTCNGTLIPLEQARDRGLLSDPKWIKRAAHSDEALEADREWPLDLEPWRSSSPAKASPAIG